MAGSLSCSNFLFLCYCFSTWPVYVTVSYLVTIHNATGKEENPTAFLRMIACLYFYSEGTQVINIWHFFVHFLFVDYGMKVLHIIKVSVHQSSHPNYKGILVWLWLTDQKVKIKFYTKAFWNLQANDPKNNYAVIYNFQNVWSFKNGPQTNCRHYSLSTLQENLPSTDLPDQLSAHPQNSILTPEWLVGPRSYDRRTTQKVTSCYNYECGRKFLIFAGITWPETITNKSSPLLCSLLLVIAALQSRVPGFIRARVLGFSCPFSSTHQHTPAVMLHCSTKKAPSFGLHSGMNIPRSDCLQI